MRDERDKIDCGKLMKARAKVKRMELQKEFEELDKEIMKVRLELRSLGGL